MVDAICQKKSIPLAAAAEAATPYKRDIGSHKIQLDRSEYSEYSPSCHFSEYIRHIRYPFPANIPTQLISVV